MQQAMLHHKGSHKTMRAGIRPKDCPTPTAQVCMGLSHNAAARPISRQVCSSNRFIKVRVGKLLGLQRAPFISLSKYK